MKNAIAIGEVCRNIKNTCHSIEDITMSIETLEAHGEGLEMFESQRFDLLEHLQQMTLQVTKMIAQAAEPVTHSTANGDDSVFAAGELSHNKGDKTQDDTVADGPVDPDTEPDEN